jgi:mono/diheme cytochrome c family protein
MAFNCAKEAPTSQPEMVTTQTPSSNSSELREQARAVVLRECGVCHDPGSGKSLKGALGIFNLQELNWAQHLDSRQIIIFKSRMKEGAAGMFDSSDPKNDGKKPPSVPLPQEADIVADYLNSLLPTHTEN